MPGLGLGLGVPKIMGKALSFDPSKLDGLQLWLDAQDSSTLNAKMGADFVSANSEYLSSSSTDFDFGDVDFTINGWFKVDSTASEQRLVAKWNAQTNNRSYLIYTNTSGQVVVIFSNNGTATTTLTSTTTISAGTWFSLSVVHDSINNLIKLSIDGATFETTAHSGGVYASSTEDFNLCYAKNASGTALYGDMVQDTINVYSKALSQAEATALYNSGNGTAYENLTASQLTSLVSWWSLNEISGTRYDAHGSNDLTDNNTVGYALGKVQEPIKANEYVWRWYDKSANAVGTYQQDIASSQAKWQNDKELYFDGEDFIVLDDLLTYVSTDTQGTICMWVKFVDATPITSNVVFSFGDTNANEYFYILLNPSGILQPTLTISGTAQWRISTNSAITSDNTWVHIAIVQNGVLPVVYINGIAVPQTTSISVNTTKWIADLTGVDNSRLGCLNWNSAGNSLFFNGSIAQPLYYNVALTQPQIQQIVNSKKSVYA